VCLGVTTAGHVRARGGDIGRGRRGALRLAQALGAPFRAGPGSFQRDEAAPFIIREAAGALDIATAPTASERARITATADALFSSRHDKAFLTTRLRGSRHRLWVEEPAESSRAEPQLRQPMVPRHGSKAITAQQLARFWANFGRQQPDCYATVRLSMPD